VSRNLQPGIHPDADQLSVFVEGAATAREQEGMLAHLADCAECRKAVFLMQPHEETQAATATATPGPVKEWIWRRLLPVGLPAAALACGLIAVVVYIRPHGGARRIPQQIAKVNQPEIERPGTTAATTANSESVARPGRPKNFAPAAVPNVSQQENQVASGLSLPKSNGALLIDQANASVAAQQTTGAAPSASAPTAGAAAGALGGIIPATASELPLNGRNFTNLQQLSTPADKKAAASQDTLAKKKDLPALEIERASGQNDTLAGVSGRITDRTGAVISGAVVTLRDATGKTRQTTTGADGTFHLTELPAGQYELMAMASGFKTNKQSIELKPSELAMLQPALDVGAASEAVTVEAGAQVVQTQSANVGVDTAAEMPSMGQVIAVPSGLPVAATVSQGKLVLSLDGAGNLSVTRNRGKKWKKINPQWAGKVVRIELTPAYKSEAAGKGKYETSGPAVFQLTTDANAVWTSKDGVHWHQQ
jgi:hypothetical protein